MAHPSDKSGPSGSGSGEPARPRTIPVADHKIDSRYLFTGTREVLIQHGGETYRLRLTSQNKLILTK